MLKIDDTVAVVAIGRPQQTQCVGMSLKKIGMFTQVSDDISGAGAARPVRRRLTATQLFWLVVRAIGQRYPQIKRLQNAQPRIRGAAEYPFITNYLNPLHIEIPEVES